MRLRALLPLVALIAAACSGSGGATPSRPAASNPAASSSSTSSSAPSSSPQAATTAGAADWPTYHGDAVRSGRSSDLTTAGRSRLLTSIKLDGAVYASPVAAADVVVAATEDDTVYGLGGGRQLWRAHLGEPSPASERPCGNVDPLGITGTPVISGDSVYLVAEFGQPVRHEIFALDLHTGAAKWHRGVDLPGRDATVMQQRGALAVAGNRVWVTFGGLAGDCGNYVGRLIGVPLNGSGDLVHYDVPTAREAGMWTPPGPVVDAAGHLLVATGNGASLPGDAYDHSDSVLELDTTAKLIDAYSPAAWVSENAGDVDLGSVGPALVASQWIVQAGKSPTVRVLRQGHLAGIGGEVSAKDVCAAYGGAAVDGGVVYLPCKDGVRAVRVDGSGTLHVLWHAASSIEGSPVIGGGRVWALDQDAGVLHALDPATGRSVAEVRVGVTSRFATPALYAGLVIVPTLTGLAFVRP